MDDLVERLRARAEFEDARVLKEVMRDGFEPVAYTGSESGRMLREAADALEAAREAAAYMRNQVKWEPCDCGCPAARTPKDARAVTWLRAAAMVNRAISGRRDE